MSEASFERAIELHRAGKLDEAAAAYERVIGENPRHAAALQFLGVIANQRGRFDRAVELISASIALDKSRPEAFVNLGNALMGIDDKPAAEQAYRRAISLYSTLPEAWFGLGNSLRQSDPAQASAAYKYATELRAGFVEALTNWAENELARGQPTLALDLFAQALRARPGAINPYLGGARALAAMGRGDEAAQLFTGVLNLPAATEDQLFIAGNALADLRRFDDAVRCYRAILARDPGLFAAVNNLGNVLRELGRLDEAEAAYRDALVLNPKSAEIVCNRALILKDMGRVAEAEAECRRSLDLETTAIGHSNLGLIQYENGRIEDALAQFQAAAKLAPESSDIRFHESVALLKLGQFAQAWPKYEARWGQRRGMARNRDFGRPQWKGEPLDGKTILIHAEQGFGDTMQFVRYAPLLAARGARVILECQPALVRLMAGVEGVSRAIPTGAAPSDCDFQCSTMSLPLAFGTTLDTIPTNVPYIRPLAEAVEQWAAQLAATQHPRIGLVWAGDARHYDIECAMIDRRRSLTLDVLAPLFDVPGASFVSLQVGTAAVQARTHPQVLDLTGSIKDFADTADLVAHLDLAICVDTAVAHLVGGMGKPIWLLSRFDGCWRWLTGRDDSPWYSTMKLFRQAAPGEWEPVVARIRDELIRWIGERGAR